MNNIKYLNELFDNISNIDNSTKRDLKTELYESLNSVCNNLINQGTQDRNIYNESFSNMIHYMFPEKQISEVTSCNIISELYHTNNPYDVVKSIVNGYSLNEAYEPEDKLTPADCIIDDIDGVDVQTSTTEDWKKVDKNTLSMNYNGNNIYKDKNTNEIFVEGLYGREYFDSVDEAKQYINDLQ